VKSGSKSQYCHDSDSMIGSWLWEDTCLVSNLPKAFQAAGRTSSSTIIEDIRAIVDIQTGTGLAFFYFDVNDKAKQTSRSALSCIVLGLTAKSDNYLPLERSYIKHDKLYLPTEDELLNLLKELLYSFHQAYIVIDALDECDNYDLLFDQVIKVVHSWDMSHLHVLVTSRREQHIVNTIEGCATTEICLIAELVGGDITSYIHSAVGKDPRMRRWGQTVQQDVVNALISGANGMYVYI
jgi:hypothetical protein